MKKALKNKEKKLKLTTLGFTLIELLAVIVILAVIALIATPLIMGVIDEARKGALERSFDNIEHAAELYFFNKYEGKLEQDPMVISMTELEHAAELYFFNKYEGKLEQDPMIIPMPELKDMVKNYNSDMDSESVVVEEKGDILTFYYTGRDNNPYKTIGTLKDKIEADTNHIKMNVVVNGETVNKVYGTKSEKDSVMKNYVWYSGNLWQVLETSDNYIKMVLAHSITAIPYGSTSDWNTSWVRKWLNDTGEEYSGIFYNGLDRQDIILNGKFCLDEVEVTTKLKVDGDTDNPHVVTVPTSSTKITSCSNVATDKIGLLTFEDYVYANTGNSATYTGGSFLDEDEFMWTMTKYTKNSTYPTTLVWTQFYNSLDDKSGTLAVDTGGTTGSVTKNSTFRTNTYGLGVRPVIYIKNDVKVREGTGTKKDPFILSTNQEYKEETALNQVTIGEYIYLDEENAPEGNHANRIVNGYSITYNKNKVQYRVIDILEDGSIKVERADILRGLDSNVSIREGQYVPFYYKWDGSNTGNTCGCENGTGETCYWTGCTNNNIYNR